jgi:Predicted 3'-5' exonuclease related to the exonuclease domain of PolB
MGLSAATQTNSNVLVWDLETIPDLKGFAAANGHDGKSDEEIREVMGDKFPKHLYHSIICIGALIAHHDGDHWVVNSLGAPHVGERSEKELILAFVNRIAELNPQLVTFNGSSFDLPVLRYRAMTHSIAAPGIAARPYFNRYTDDAVDLCDLLSSFSFPSKSDPARDLPRDGIARQAKWHQRCRGGEIFSRWAHSRDCGLLQKRCDQHLPSLAAVRIIPWQSDGCGISGEREEPCGIH